MLNITSRRILFILGIPKTLWFNFHYLPFQQAIRLPIWISHRVWIRKGQGCVAVSGKSTPGKIQIGFNDIGIFDQVRSRSIWEVAGAVNFKGVAYIGHGSKISVTSSGTLTFGDGVTFNAESSVACTKRIDFGAGCMISWQVQIMDSDLHKVVSTLDLRHLNPDEPVDIGEHVWLGSRVTVLKGTRIGTGSVVATGAVCAGDLSLGNAVYGGVPARMIRKGVAWQR